MFEDHYPDTYKPFRVSTLVVAPLRGMIPFNSTLLAPNRLLGPSDGCLVKAYSATIHDLFGSQALVLLYTYGR